MNYQPLRLHTRVVLNRSEPAALYWGRIRAYMLHMHRFAFHRDQKQERQPAKK
jgi:hypothetical protein